MAEDLESRKLEQEARYYAALADRTEAEAEIKLRQRDMEFAQQGEAGEFLFYTEVDDATVFTVIRQLSNWSNRFPGEPITLVFHSPGGLVIDGLHLFDYIRGLMAKGHHVTTKATGYAASMGAVLLQAGDHRTMTPNAYLMLHEVSAGALGSLSEMEERIAFNRRLNGNLLDILAERSAYTAEEISDMWRKTDCWLSATEALEQGFIDEIVD